MKTITTPIIPVEDKQTVVTPVENETQRQLRAVLEYWGPNGERWARGIGNGSDTFCFINTLAFTQNNHVQESVRDWAPTKFADEAAKEMGFEWYIQCSDSGFDNARKMVLRAIELAQS